MGLGCCWSEKCLASWNWDALGEPNFIWYRTELYICKNSARFRYVVCFPHGKLANILDKPPLSALFLVLMAAKILFFCYIFTVNKNKCLNLIIMYLNCKLFSPYLIRGSHKHINESCSSTNPPKSALSCFDH